MSYSNIIVQLNGNIKAELVRDCIGCVSLHYARTQYKSQSCNEKVVYLGQKQARVIVVEGMASLNWPWTPELRGNLGNLVWAFKQGLVIQRRNENTQMLW